MNVKNLIRRRRRMNACNTAPVDVERLENRQLLTSITYSGGIVSISGSNLNDTATVEPLSNFRLKMTISNQIATVTRTFSWIREIRFKGFAGADRFQHVSWSYVKTHLDGGSGNDTLSGGAGNDTILGQTGNDYLYARGGNDILHGHEGRDAMWGQSGYDQLYGGNGNDLVIGGDHADTLEGELGNDTLYGGSGNDSMLGGGHADTLYGGDGNDTAYGGAGHDSIFGQAGNDFLDGGNRHWIFTNQVIKLPDHSDDTIRGGTGDDRLVGGYGNDNLRGGDGIDRLFGGHGDDFLDGSQAGRRDYDRDSLYGGEGTDTIVDYWWSRWWGRTGHEDWASGQEKEINIRV